MRRGRTVRNDVRDAGALVRERLRRGVEASLAVLGQGFLEHPGNDRLRARLQDGELSIRDYFDQLLRVLYRLIVLLVLEERDMLHTACTSGAARAAYAEGFGMLRLRAPDARDRFDDQGTELWEILQIVFRAVAFGEPVLGWPAFGGMFAEARCPALEGLDGKGAKLENGALLLALAKLGWVHDETLPAPPNWADVTPEHLGSIHESVLALIPQVVFDGWRFSFADEGSKNSPRKLSGSYYTPDSLVQVVLDRALEPVIAEVVARHPDRPSEALLGLSIVDPACGAGHFLLAAARRLAGHVARVRAPVVPSADDYREALRQVVRRCIHGVDLDPLAVALCKVSLWMEAAEPGVPFTFVDDHVQHGNALLGATPGMMFEGVPDAAWEPVEGDEKKTAAALRRRNREERTEAAREPSGEGDPRRAFVWDGVMGSPAHRRQTLVADAWCAAFFWPKQPGGAADAAPTTAVWRRLLEPTGEPPPSTVAMVGELAAQHHFFHWHLRFPDVFAKGGFDVVLGNPPWIAHAGRAAQPIADRLKAFYQANFESFANYPTTHGMFATVAARCLRLGGCLGLVVPSSLSELDGYAPTRRAHDTLCAFEGDLVDFGEGRFAQVTQPCMALVSRRRAEGRIDAEPGSPWPMLRPDLDEVARGLMARLGRLPCLPPESFGERGIQSDKVLWAHFQRSRAPVDRFTTPIREGTDVREFQLLSPRLHVDRAALGIHLRTADEFAAVDIVVRQTARYPIAALSDGVAFRNSLLAGFGSERWTAEALVALLNSALIRWFHYVRFRDARQPVMPQLKIGHLRAIPEPPATSCGCREALAILGRWISDQGGAVVAGARARLDDFVFDLFDLSGPERALVAEWHDDFGPSLGSEARDATPTSGDRAGEDDAALKMDP